ncbi:hypothetical protein PVK06_030002 [Gossypium arboreum]|uniref:Uncharacterized protein n=1 Tax=Gossypium arboreum TaxID=29729 RepID=A0ABR0NM36_GOSAR|nr:hypothetical protein PVK06_030002 [Gossypium arboreum]
MTHPNNNFSSSFPSVQVVGSGTSNQPSGVDLFVCWFVDRPENLGNSSQAGIVVEVIVLGGTTPRKQ